MEQRSSRKAYTDLLPAVLIAGSLEVGQEAAVRGVPAAHLLHADHLLVLDVEHEVAVGLLLLDVIVFDFHSLVYLHPTGHGVCVLTIV